jgi:hypothetical protein
MAASIPTVDHYHWYDNSGGEGVGSLATTDTNAAITIGGNTIVRIRLSISFASAVDSSTWKIKVAHNGGAFNTVGSASTYMQGAVSSNITDGGTTTQLITSAHTFFSSANTFSSNVNALTPGNTGSVPVGDCIEIEWAVLLIFADLTSGDTLDINLLHNSGSIEGAIVQYVGNVRLTVTKTSHAKGGEFLDFFMAA